MLRRARLYRNLCDSKSSVCPSVTLRYDFHIGWKLEYFENNLTAILRPMRLVTPTRAIWCNGKQALFQFSCFHVNYYWNVVGLLTDDMVTVFHWIAKWKFYFTDLHIPSLESKLCNIFCCVVSLRQRRTCSRRQRDALLFCSPKKSLDACYLVATRVRRSNQGSKIFTTAMLLITLPFLWKQKSTKSTNRYLTRVTSCHTC